MMTLAECAAAVGGRLHGADATFSEVVSDTRALARGALFVVLKGPRFDAHEFLPQARAHGAAGALVARRVDDALPQVEVDDTRRALGRLAAHWRARFDLPVVAVTGSNGKTTVKNMIAACLREAGAALATEGNLNNDIGVPLTLLRLRASHRYAVIEMGMNHPGEIDYLTRLTRPDVALITNAAAAHLAGLGSVENVAHAKGEIFAGLRPNGIAVINADDDFAPLWRELAARARVMTFGFAPAAQVRGAYRTRPDGIDLQITTERGETSMRLSLLGKHNAANALAASAAALAVGVGLDDIKRGLEKLRAASGRLEIKRGVKGVRVLDDTYNANPGSVAAGLEVLREAQGERVLVLGDMGELGDAAADIHRRVGALARRVGIDALWAVGPLTRLAVEAFGDGGAHFESAEALVDALRARANPRLTVLVKGSRAMKMERVVAGIAEAEAR